MSAGLHDICVVSSSFRNLAALRAALPPLAPDFCRCESGWPLRDVFLAPAVLRYRVVDCTPCRRASCVRYQTLVAFLGSPLAFITQLLSFSKACLLVSARSSKSQRSRIEHTLFIDRLCRILFCHPFVPDSLGFVVYNSNHSYMSRSIMRWPGA